MIEKGVYFISGIDTDCGKSHVTGLIARNLQNNGVRVVTQKLIQTGCIGVSEDIITHRRIMGIDLLPEDIDMTTCPIVFTHPCSPHLAARLDGRSIDLDLIKHSTEVLKKRFEVVLVEGAGGILVPVTEEYSMADYAAEMHLPVIFVTTAKLGSINHAMLSIEYCLSRGIEIAAIAYNVYGENDQLIVDDTRELLKSLINKRLPQTEFMEFSDQVF